MSKWKSQSAEPPIWRGAIANSAAKEEVARRIAEEVRDGQIIGAGSGSTSFLAVRAIAERMAREKIACTMIPTSAETEMVCASLGISTTTVLSSRPDWAFDGADEVDPSGNLIKGRGGAMFREKLLMRSSPRNYILIDRSKLVKALGEKYPIPVEVYPDAVHYVQDALASLGAAEVQLRSATAKDGPVITEAGNFILDTRFPAIRPELEREIKLICGVLESGLFIGYNPQIVLATEQAQAER